jgi:uncharacterized protein
MEILTLTIIVFLLMFLGLVGIILPVLPGLILCWAGFFLYAWMGNFQAISLTIVLVFLVFSFLLSFFDYLLPILGARKYQASRKGLWGAGLGLFLGGLFFGPLGIILGPFLGTLLGEIYDKKDILAAIKAARASVIGILISTLVKLVLGLVMLGWVVFSLIG